MHRFYAGKLLEEAVEDFERSRRIRIAVARQYADQKIFDSGMAQNE
jgi:hypothetical protein